MNFSSADPLTMVYHELRGPLGLMATAARSAAEDCADDALRARCEVIVRAAERMLRTAGRVLDLAHAAELQASELFDPAEVVRSTINDLTQMSAPVALTELSTTPGCISEGDAAQLEALVQSLITNASDHAEPGTSINVIISERLGRLRVEFVQIRLRPLSLGYVADVALDHLRVVNVVDVADELRGKHPSIACLKRQVLVADIACCL